MTRYLNNEVGMTKTLEWLLKQMKLRKDHKDYDSNSNGNA